MWHRPSFLRAADTCEDAEETTLPDDVGEPGLLGVTIRPSGQLRRSATTRASVSVTTLGSNGLATAMPNASAPRR